ncbi:MerR family transcriptional regulator [Cryptosporangium aurantiacum]|uniref:DNA-binding transcriptional regulator, MerR family n=1 Tax=Cryptosporangium aurantiacum TaxID=134849 RepID=A0A1M7TW04_9ACTN|nr:MerR family transcriptional regulator [Cryptosporangium aurantiacum]SHN74891.1 DNA-binding transcriptional regulator, MerR family [Cryptosporangium aurantiacum]
MTSTGVGIGEVARRTGLSVHTLRLYERAGVLAGPVRRDAAGRRVYSEWDLTWLANCVLFRASGMPLATLAELARLVGEGSGNEAERLEILRAHRRRVGEQMARLTECLELIDAKVTAYEKHLSSELPGDPWQPEPAQPRALVRAPGNGDLTA